MNILDKLLTILSTLLDLFKKSVDKKEKQDEAKTRDDIINNPADVWLYTFGGRDGREGSDTATNSQEFHSDEH